MEVLKGTMDLKEIIRPSGGMIAPMIPLLKKKWFAGLKTSSHFICSALRSSYIVSRLFGIILWKEGNGPG